MDNEIITIVLEELNVVKASILNWFFVCNIYVNVIAYPKTVANIVLRKDIWAAKGIVKIDNAVKQAHKIPKIA